MTIRRARATTVAVILVVAALVASGCSGGTDSGGTDSDGSSAVSSEGTGSASSTPESGDRFPVTIEHMLGSATITEEPERIVALGLADQDIAIALGVTPVAMIENPYRDDRRYPWTGGSELDEVKLLPMEVGSASIEQIVALQPDLILATTVSADPSLYDRYVDAGVPILAPPDGAVTASWQDLTLTIGKALGRSERAREVIAETEAVLAQTREDLPGIEGRTFAVAVASTSSQVRVVNKPTDTAAKLFADLGMVLPDELTELDGVGGVGAVDIGLEQLDLLGADALFMATVGDARDSIEKSPLFQRLPAVTAGTYLAYESTVAAGLRVPTPLSIPYVLSVIRPTLERLSEL